MPRPSRIEYSGAFHHVMNRGRNRNTIFHDRSDYDNFIKTLEEATKRFDAVIHAYCLMSNHYHLLIETPKANLSRIMQHINGLYTQRYNRKHKRDGTLFRGRYKSVLVDQDSYLLQLSRYIHRNPLEVKKKIVEYLVDYEWSSYPAYINKVPAQEWLTREKTYQMLGQKQRYRGYADYVEQGVDEDIKQYYNKGNILSVFGDKEFKHEVESQVKTTDLTELRVALQNRPSISEIVQLIGKLKKVSEIEITQKCQGQRKNMPIRAFAMFVCQRYGDVKHAEIAKHFGLSHAGSASHSIARIRRDIAEGGWKKELKNIEKSLLVVK